MPTYVEFEEDDGSVRRVRARRVKNISSHVVKVELRLGEGVANPAYHGQPGFLQPVLQATGAPEFLAPAYLISAPDGGVRRVRSAAKPPPQLYIEPGQVVAIPWDQVRAVVDIRCDVCAAPRHMTCVDPTHPHRAVGGSAGLMRLVDDDGNEENVPIHPALEPPPALPPVDAAGLHDRVMARLGGAK